MLCCCCLLCCYALFDQEALQRAGKTLPAADSPYFFDANIDDFSRYLYAGTLQLQAILRLEDGTALEGVLLGDTQVALKDGFADFKLKLPDDGKHIFTKNGNKLYLVEIGIADDLLWQHHQMGSAAGRPLTKQQLREQYYPLQRVYTMPFKSMTKAPKEKAGGAPPAAPGFTSPGFAPAASLPRAEFGGGLFGGGLVRDPNSGKAGLEQSRAKRRSAASSSSEEEAFQLGGGVALAAPALAAAPLGHDPADQLNVMMEQMIAHKDAEIARLKAENSHLKRGSSTDEGDGGGGLLALLGPETDAAAARLDDAVGSAAEAESWLERHINWSDALIADAVDVSLGDTVASSESLKAALPELPPAAAEG